MPESNKMALEPAAVGLVRLTKMSTFPSAHGKVQLHCAFPKNIRLVLYTALCHQGKYARGMTIERHHLEGSERGIPPWVGNAEAKPHLGEAVV